MRTARYLALAVGVIVATTAMGAAVATAATPSLLIGGVASTNAVVVGSGGKSTLQTLSGKTVTCTGVTSVGALTSATKGTGTATFTGCAAAGVKCTGLSQPTAGEIVVKGTSTLVFDAESPALGVAIKGELEPVHFSCSAKLIIVLGCGLALIKPINTLVAAGTNYEVIQNQSGGDNEDTKYTENSGEAQKSCIALTGENEGTEESFGEAVTSGVGRVQVGGVNVASELMG